MFLGASIALCAGDPDIARHSPLLSSLFQAWKKVPEWATEFYGGKRNSVNPAKGVKSKKTS